MKRIIFYYLVFLIIPVFVQGQHDSSLTTGSSVLYEKLYLHVDREIYSPGEDIWFKVYLVGGINHQLIPGFKNVYVQLIADDGKIIDNQLIMTMNGVAANDFRLNDSIPEGNYIIRAWTKYLLNFGEESVFHKRIAIANPGNSLEYKPKQAMDDRIDLQFLPAGGSLVLNAANHVAFRATDQSGRGVPVAGKIVDEAGEEVASFKSSYRGMGSFIFMPAENKTYRAIAESHPGISTEIAKAVPDGVALHYRPNGNYLRFTLNRNMKAEGTRHLVLKVFHKGIELFSEEVEMDQMQHQLNLFKGLFPAGISKITLMDEQQNVLAERLVFVRNAEDKPVEIRLNKNTFAPHDSINVDILTLLDPGKDSIDNTLSIAVVNADYFSEGGPSQSIESWLLLDSELKGPVESPASLFVDDQEITSEEKLDLVMMINGWRRYYWEDLEKYAGLQLPGWDDAGVTITGKVDRLFGEKPVENGIVTLGPFSNNFVILKDTTDALGRFLFERLYLKDSAEVMINATNKRGSNSVEVFNDTPAIFDSIVPVSEMAGSFMDVRIPESYYRASFYKRISEREYELEHGSILLGDVEVEGKKPFGYSYINAVWGSADRTFNISEDGLSYANIIDYVETMVPGISMGDTSFIYRRDRVQLLLDGFSVDLDELQYIPMGDIAQVDFYKGAMNTARFGTEGGGYSAVLSFLTKSGSDSFYSEFRRIVQGRIVPRVRGFKQAREFYSPAYPLQSFEDQRRPDYRPTMYWNPDVEMINGKAAIRFFSSDMIGRFKVIVEGISRKGKPVYGTSELNVEVPFNGQD